MPKLEKGEVVLEGEKIPIKKGGLRQQLKLKKGDEFKLPELKKLQKVEVGDSFTFRGNQFKKTKLMAQRINLAITLMSKKKK